MLYWYDTTATHLDSLDAVQFTTAVDELLLKQVRFSIPKSWMRKKRQNATKEDEKSFCFFSSTASSTIFPQVKDRTHNRECDKL